MHRILIAAITFICIISAMDALPPEWEAFQRELGLQAAQYKDSPEHLALRERDTRDYEVGDTKTFWRWNLSVMPPTWIQTPATCRAVGAHSYVFIADSEWNVHMTQANVDTIMVRLEENTPNQPDQGAIAMDIAMFGPIPDEIDNDPKLIVFYSALGQFQGNYFDGYFSPYNQVTEAQAMQMNPPGHSNECEMIYMTCYPLSPVAPIRMSVLAHELQHLIHWGQDANEDTWLNEGCSELAMVAYGIPDPITGFPSNPDNSLTAWNQQTTDYVKVMLFFTYLYEHYDEFGLIADLVADPANGMASLAQQLEQDYPGLGIGNLLHNWSIANVLDSPEPAAGLYNYEYLDLPNFTMTNVNQYPSQTNQTIQAYASDYLKFTFDQRPVAFSFQTAEQVVASALLMDQSGNCVSVLEHGVTNSIEYNPLPAGVFQVIFVLTNHNNIPILYEYSTTTVSSSNLNNPPVTQPRLECHPNPFSSRCTVMLKAAGKGSIGLNIYNQRGQKVRSFHPLASSEGTAQVDWDGRDDDGHPVGKGVYIMRLSAGEDTVVRKVLLID
jgi:hypothetical protein